MHARSVVAAAIDVVSGEVVKSSLSAPAMPGPSTSSPAALEAHLQKLTGPEAQLTLVPELARLRAASGRAHLDATLL